MPQQTEKFDNLKPHSPECTPETAAFSSSPKEQLLDLQRQKQTIGQRDDSQLHFDTAELFSSLSRFGTHPVNAEESDSAKKPPPPEGKANGKDKTSDDKEDKPTSQMPFDTKTEDDKPREQQLPKDANLEKERARLTDAANRMIPEGADRQKFSKDMKQFEKRAAEQGLSAGEVAATYAQLTRLLTAPDGHQSMENRVLAVKSLAHHLANPTNIDQGNHSTCIASALQERLTTRTPSKAAEIVATMALTGGWVAPDGKAIKSETDSLKPGAEERQFPPPDGQRSYATQLINLALINDTTQRRATPQIYSQQEPSDPNDTGERLHYANDIKGGGTRDRTSYESQGINYQDILASGRRLTGDSNFIVTGPGHHKPEMVPAGSTRELADIFSKMKTDKQFPAIIVVDANHELFAGTGDSISQQRKQPGMAVDLGDLQSAGQRWHGLCVTDFDQKTGRVKLSNQWGNSEDKMVPIKDLYRAMRVHH